MLVVISPLVLLNGYVYGYVSILSYDIKYMFVNVTAFLPSMDHLALVRQVLFYYLLSLTALSVVALVLSRRSPFDSVAVSYGVALSLVTITGVLRMIAAALAYDLEIYEPVLKPVLVSKTLAGTAVTSGTVIEYTITYKILTWILPIISQPIIVLIPLSVSAMGIWAIYGLSNAWAKVLEAGRVLASQTPTAVALVTILTSTMAGVFAYTPAELSVLPVAPPVKLQQPSTTYCTALTRTSRGAIVYTDFETYPVPGWANRGGSWSSVPGGYKGNALQGTDNNGGVGGASQYYWATPISGYSSLWVSLKTRLISSAETYRGLIIMDSSLQRGYEISVYSGRLEIWSYVGNWFRHAATGITGYSMNTWYTIVVYYTLSGNSISITAYVFNPTGTQVATTSASITGNRFFQPAYIGVEIDGTGTVYFDDFIASTVDLRTITVQGVPVGYTVELWDNLGNLVASTTASTTSAALNVVNDIVVGTGSGGRVVVKFPNSSTCLTYIPPSGDAILGGDTYSLNTPSWLLGANYTTVTVSAKIPIPPSSSSGFSVSYINNTDPKPYYARLVLANYTDITGLTANITLYNSTYTSQPITISNGTLATSSTDWVLTPGNSMGEIYFSGYYATAGQQGTLNLYLQLCTQPDEGGACVYYPVVISVYS